MDGRTGFVEEENEFVFEHICFVVLEGHPDIWLEGYNVGLSSWLLLVKILGTIHMEMIVQLDNIIGGRNNWTRVKSQIKIRN